MNHVKTNEMRDGESSRTKWDEMRQTELSRGFDW